MFQQFPLFLASFVMLQTIIRLKWFGIGNIYDILTETLSILRITRAWNFIRSFKLSRRLEAFYVSGYRLRSQIYCPSHSLLSNIHH